MQLISVEGMTNETAPKGKVLIQYLEPSWGRYSIEMEVGYYDNPLDYEKPSEGEGWKLWLSSSPIKVTHYAVLPEKQETPFSEMTQKEFIGKYGDFPNLGSVHPNM